MITSAQIHALYRLYPQVFRTNGIEAFDADNNIIEYDLDAVIAEAEALAQAQIDTKQAALNKLMALGLTEEEALALGK